jgi:transposase
MKKQNRTNPRPENPQNGTQQEKNSSRYEVIKLGIDWHARQYRVARIIDNAAPEPAQCFTPEAFLRWAQGQLERAEKVVSCYEAGAGGFVLHRQLTALGVKNLVVAPRKLDRNQRGVKTDKTDARDLAMDLDRYVRGNDKALRVVFVPSPEQEQQRVQTRQRQQLQQKRLALAAQGRSLLLGQGWRESNQWWKARRWAKLEEILPGWLVDALKVWRELIVSFDQAMGRLQRQIQKAAPAFRPKGLGAMTYEEIVREVADFGRFKNRKAPGSYIGLCGGVSASAEKVRDLSITKAGNRRLRTMLIEAAWRWVIYQPQSRAVQRWREVLLAPAAHRRGRKRAIVALARQLFVDLWRWQTGRANPEQLGWKMVTAA